MLDTCPLCGRPLRIGADGKQYIKYDSEYQKKFEAGEITLEELSKHISVFYDRQMLCFNAGNQNSVKVPGGAEILIDPPCANYYAIRGGTIENPDVVVETVTIADN